MAPPEIDRRARGFGEDVTFVLKNPAWKWTGWAVFLVALAASPYFIADDKPRGQLMRHVVAPLLFIIGGWMGQKGIRLIGAKDGSAVVTARRLVVTLPGGEPREIELASVGRVWHVHRNGVVAGLRVERDDEPPFLLGSVFLEPRDQTVLAAILTRRAAIRRAGVKSATELAAAEAYLAALASGVRPVGVAVQKDGPRRYAVTLLGSDLASPEGAEVYVPADVLAVLREDRTDPAGAKPLRGVA